MDIQTLILVIQAPIILLLMAGIFAPWKVSRARIHLPKESATGYEAEDLSSDYKKKQATGSKNLKPPLPAL